MKTMSAAELRGNLAAALDAVESDAEELVITRAGHEPLVVVSLAEYALLRETDTCCGRRATPSAFAVPCRSTGTAARRPAS